MEQTSDKETNIKSIFIFILIVVITIGLGTYAWITYRSKNTAMVLTIGDLNNVQITLKPYQLDLELTPMLTYTSLDNNGDYVTVSAVNNSSSSQKFSLFYDIHEIDLGLQNSNFRYTIVRQNDSDTITGNFADANTTDDFYILNATIPANTTYTYRVYTWLYGNGNQSSGLSFKGDLSAKIGPLYVYTGNTIWDYNDPSIFETNAVHIGYSIPNGVTMYSTPEDAMTAFENSFYDEWNETESFPFFLRHVVGDGTKWCYDHEDDAIGPICAFDDQTTCNAEDPDGGNTCYEHTFTNGVSESYVGFVITPEMAANSSGISAGTYYLKGGDAGAAFLDNAKILYDALGSYCDTNPYITTPTSDFMCHAYSNNLYDYSFGTSSTGYAYVYDGFWGVGCDISIDGYSSCSAS